MPWDAYTCPCPQERNRGSEEDELFLAKSMVPLAAGLGHPLPSATTCSEVPWVDSPLPSPHPQPVHLAQVSFVIPAFNSNFTLDLELNQ